MSTNVEKPAKGGFQVGSFIVLSVSTPIVALEPQMMLATVREPQMAPAIAKKPAEGGLQNGFANFLSVSTPIDGSEPQTTPATIRES